MAEHTAADPSHGPAPRPSGAPRDQLEAAQTTIAEINSQMSEARDEEVKQRRYLYCFGYVALAALTLGGVALLQRLSGRTKEYFGSMSLALVLISFGLFVATGAKWSRLRRLRDDVQDLRFEKDLLRYNASLSESRAEKLLSINQYQLRRYYELTLSQSMWVFVIGIVCLAAGIGVIGATFYYVRRPATTNQTQVIIGVVGAVASILINYVAAVYLKMHSATAVQMAEFHAKLVATHELFFANMLTSGVNEASERSKTLGQLALAIAQKNQRTTSAPP